MGTMSKLDAAAIRALLGDLASLRLAGFEAFAEIDSTNSYLMQREAPTVGGMRVALTDNQTHGRGRHGRDWRSPAGSGLCLSIAYTFASQPANLAAFTLAVGLGVAEALDDLGAAGVQLKWPNDLVVNDAKLGGILTEAQAPQRGSITVVTGIGINVDLHDVPESDLDREIADLAAVVSELPDRNELAARLIDGVCETFVTYETTGFSTYIGRWPQRDWLFGRRLTVSTPHEQIRGTGAGIADDGSLLVDAGSGELNRVTSGTIISATFAGRSP